MKFILIRHTVTDYNIAKRIQGRTDTELTEQGCIDAEELSNKLQGLGISKIITSNLKRCSKTAEIINSKLKVPITSDKRLRECSFGLVEGMTREEAIAKHGQSITKNWDDQYKEYDFRKFGGENQKSVLMRHLDLLKDCSKSNSEETVILLVGHGRGMATLLATLGYEPLLKKGEYCIIEY